MDHAIGHFFQGFVLLLFSPTMLWIIWICVLKINTLFCIELLKAAIHMFLTIVFLKEFDVSLRLFLNKVLEVEKMFKWICMLKINILFFIELLNVVIHIFLTIVCLKEFDDSLGLFLKKVLEVDKMFKHFALLPKKVGLGEYREIVNEGKYMSEFAKK